MVFQFRQFVIFYFPPLTPPLMDDKPPVEKEFNNKLKALLRAASAGIKVETPIHPC